MGPGGVLEDIYKTDHKSGMFLFYFTSFVVGFFHKSDVWALACSQGWQLPMVGLYSGIRGAIKSDSEFFLTLKSVHDDMKFYLPV